MTPARFSRRYASAEEEEEEEESEQGSGHRDKGSEVDVECVSSMEDDGGTLGAATAAETQSESATSQALEASMQGLKRRPREEAGGRGGAILHFGTAETAAEAWSVSEASTETHAQAAAVAGAGSREEKGGAGSRGGTKGRGGGGGAKGGGSGKRGPPGLSSDEGEAGSLPARKRQVRGKESVDAVRQGSGGADSARSAGAERSGDDSLLFDGLDELDSDEGEGEEEGVSGGEQPFATEAHKRRQEALLQAGAAALGLSLPRGADGAETERFLRELEEAGVPAGSHGKR